jgi:hypothetical protein
MPDRPPLDDLRAVLGRLLGLDPDHVEQLTPSGLLVERPVTDQG